MMYAFGIVTGCAIAGLYLLARSVSLLDQINKRLAALEQNTHK